jgi:hypothetical protein
MPAEPVSESEEDLPESYVGFGDEESENMDEE